MSAPGREKIQSARGTAVVSGQQKAISCQLSAVSLNQKPNQSMSAPGRKKIQSTQGKAVVSKKLSAVSRQPSAWTKKSNPLTSAPGRGRPSSARRGQNLPAEPAVGAGRFCPRSGGQRQPSPACALHADRPALRQAQGSARRLRLPLKGGV